MTRILKNVFLLATLALSLWGCDSSTGFSTETSAVQSLYVPEGDYSVTLEANSSETFEWAPAKAEDGGLVMYEVAFDSPDGDFSDPLYRVPSDNNGVATTATISHETLNKAAAQAGLESQETGQLAWTVISSKGVNEKVSPERRAIQITRLPGFANPPSNLYLTGDGTEAGGNLADAMQLKPTGDGQFEIYTRLTEGSFIFVNDVTGSPREFSIADGSIMENSSGSTVEASGVYRIRLNFTTGSANLAQIENFEMYLSPADEYLFNLPYQEDGVFMAEEQPFSFAQPSYGPDSRYKFRMTLSQNGEQFYEWWGNDVPDVGRPDDSSPDSYFFLYPVPESGGQFDYIFKMPLEFDQSLINVTAYFQAGREQYTHEVVRVADQ